MPGPPLAAEVAAFAVARTGRARVELRGASMAPTLRAGMVAEVERLDGDPRPGDILIFRGPTGLIAHRLVALRGDSLVTCGDALPNQLETVPRDMVVGRVARVWSSIGTSGRPLAAPLSRARGRLMLRSRRWRALVGGVRVRVGGYVRPRAFLRYARPRFSFLRARVAGVAEPTAFRRLVAATFAFERGDARQGVALLASVPLDALVAVAVRHQLGGLVSRWLETAAAEEVSVPNALRETFRQVRFQSALQAGRVIRRLRSVVERLRIVGIEPIALKGGARLARADTDAQLHYAGDIDVLVPFAQSERATATLLAAGYRQEFSPDRIAFFARRHQHRAPLIVPGERVPVELHVTLSTPRSVTQPLDYARLFPHSEFVNGPAGSVRVLNRVYSALHLAYHGHDLRVWRDIVLLSRLLRAMTPAERAEFDALAAAERRNRVRLQAAICAADALSGVPVDPLRNVRRYLAWSIEREDFPELLRRRSHIVEGIAARNPRHYLGWRESLRQLKGWTYNVAVTPAILRYWLWSGRVRGPAIAALGLRHPSSSATPSNCRRIKRRKL